MCTKFGNYANLTFLDTRVGKKANCNFSSAKWSCRYYVLFKIKDKQSPKIPSSFDIIFGYILVVFTNNIESEGLAELG